MCAGQAGDATFATEFRGRICSPQLRALHGTSALRKRLFDGDDYYAFRQDAIERKTLIAATEPRTPSEQKSLDAALFERTRADRYEVALRSALSNMEQGSYAVAKAQIGIALLH